MNLRYTCLAYRTQGSLQGIIPTYHTLGSFHWSYSISSCARESTIFFICSCVIRGKSGWDCLLWKELSSMIFSSAHSLFWVLTFTEKLHPWAGHVNEYCILFTSLWLKCDAFRNFLIHYWQVLVFPPEDRISSHPATTNCPPNSSILKETPWPSSLSTKDQGEEGAWRGILFFNFIPLS